MQANNVLYRLQRPLWTTLRLALAPGVGMLQRVVQVLNFRITAAHTRGWSCGQLSSTAHTAVSPADCAQRPHEHHHRIAVEGHAARVDLVGPDQDHTGAYDQRSDQRRDVYLMKHQPRNMQPHTSQRPQSLAAICSGPLESQIHPVSLLSEGGVFIYNFDIPWLDWSEMRA